MKTFRPSEHKHYNACCSISARVWLTVINVDLTAVALKPNGTLTLVSINKILYNICIAENVTILHTKNKYNNIIMLLQYVNLRCKCLGFDKGLANTHWFPPDNLFPHSLEDRNRYTHHDYHYDKWLHFGMVTVAHREADLSIIIIQRGIHDSSFQFLPTSQLLPKYPEWQIHSFGTLQYPPTGAVSEIFLTLRILKKFVCTYSNYDVVYMCHNFFLSIHFCIYTCIPTYEQYR